MTKKTRRPLDVRRVAIAEARKILRAAIRMFDPPYTAGEEARVLDAVMRSYVLPSPVLVEEQVITMDGVPSKGFGARS